MPSQMFASMPGYKYLAIIIIIIIIIMTFH